MTSYFSKKVFSIQNRKINPMKSKRHAFSTLKKTINHSKPQVSKKERQNSHQQQMRERNARSSTCPFFFLFGTPTVYFINDFTILR